MRTLRRTNSTAQDARGSSPSSGLLFVTLVLAAAPAAADATGFSLERFEPAEAGSAWFSLDSLDLRGSPRPALGLVADLAYKPLVSYSARGDEVQALVSQQTTFHLSGSLVLADRFRLGLSVPFVALQSGTTATLGGVTYPAPVGAALGDVRASGDVRLVGDAGDPVTAAAGLQLWLPTGDRAAYAGDGGFRLLPHVSVSGNDHLIAWAGEVGLLYRAQGDAFAGTPRGSELSLSFAAGVRLLHRKLLVGPELTAATRLGDGFLAATATPVEAILGAHYELTEGLTLAVGAGPGLSRGLGTPRARFLFSLVWSPPLPEAVAAPPPLVAAPLPDRDHDGVPDDVDACPDVAGVATNDLKTNGCPPAPPPAPPPSITPPAPPPPVPPAPAPPPPPQPPPPPPPPPDAPFIPFVAKPDRDKDGIPDVEDACPLLPGPRTADPKTNGCPTLDTDQDGVPDYLDNCPTEPGPASNQGCPEAKRQLVIVKRDRIDIKDKVYFASGKAAILPKSFPLLDQVADQVKRHTEIPGLVIEGHTDSQGNPQTNRKLSQARADAVKAYLIKRGVEASRLEAKGYGADRPTASNATATGREANRRVGFTIAGIETTAPAAAPATPVAPAKPAAAAKKKGGKR